ncbi:MAG: PAC2 family protein [Chloroflexi bacterium]|nr:PAC2 family protein [Chloroflexota bacterium]
MRGAIRLYARPKLKSPILQAARPGLGNVALIVASYLKSKLNFKELGEVEAPLFFDPIGVSVKENIVEAPQFPASAFFYWKNRTGDSDIILFIGEDQPSSKGYELAHCVLDVGLKFQAGRVYTFAAAMTRMHHTENPKVWGVSTVPELTGDLKKHNLVQAGNLQIAGLNGLLLGAAKERGVEGICLLAEVPVYASRIQNPMAALAVVKALLKVLDIKLDVSDLEQLAAETKEKMKQLAAQAMGEYIDFFTEPIWESGESEEEDEENGGNGEEN